MKKGLIIIAAALILALTAAGCGTKNTGNTASSGASSSNSSQPADVSDAYSEKVDMDIVQGTEAKSDSQENEYEGKLGAAKVSIDDAKLINYEDEDVVIVSFDFENKSDSPQSFTGLFEVTATQNGGELSSAVVYGVEGVELLSMGENVPSGESIDVQMAYKVKDKSAPVTIELREFEQNEDSAEPLTKTFTF